MVVLAPTGLNPGVMQPPPLPVFNRHNPISQAKYWDTHAADLCQVSMHWSAEAGERDDAQAHIVTGRDVDAFIKACLDVHYDPKLSLGRGVHATQVAYITVARMHPSDPYWWSTPNDGSPGAVTWSFDASPAIFWVRPGLELSSNTYCVFARALD